MYVCLWLVQVVLYYINGLETIHLLSKVKTKCKENVMLKF